MSGPKGELVPCHYKQFMPEDSRFDKGWSGKLRESSNTLVDNWKPTLPMFQQHPQLPQLERKDFAMQVT